MKHLSSVPPLIPQIEALQTGQKLSLRLGRGGRHRVLWRPWHEEELYIQRFNGKVEIIALANNNWAEYGPTDYDVKADMFLVEDYYMQIKWPAAAP